MAVSKRTRYEVLNRDGFACRYCHETDIPLTIDHVVPVALGGSDKPDNLVAACCDCNYGKASTNPDAEQVEQVNADALRWAAAMRAAGEAYSAKRSESNWAIDLFNDRFSGDWVPSGYHERLRSLVAAGLTRETLIDAIDVANGAHWAEDPFRYFCGVAWNKVQALQEAARELIEEAGD